jgi:hypothetical protein
LPEACNFVVDGPVGGGLVYGAAKFIGQCESEAHLILDCASKIWIVKQAIAGTRDLAQKIRSKVGFPGCLTGREDEALDRNHGCRVLLNFAQSCRSLMIAST